MPNVGKPLDDQVPRPSDRDTPGASGPLKKPLVDESEIAGSMETEEPAGWDLAPQDIHDPRQKRHPRPDGIGGLKPAKDDKD